MAKNDWVKALEAYNRKHGTPSGSFVIPKKGTQGYKEVQSMMGRTKPFYGSSSRSTRK